MSTMQSNRNPVDDATFIICIIALMVGLSLFYYCVMKGIRPSDIPGHVKKYFSEKAAQK